MAIFHLAVKILSRGKGQSAIAAASYRSGEKIRDEIENVIKDSRHGKGGVEYAEVIGFPGSREMLWNLAEQSEKRKDARTAREIEIALPAELSLVQRIELVKDYAKDLISRYGMACDISLHKPERGDNNYHAHILTTVRAVEGDKLGGKIKSLDSIKGGEEITKIREAWERFINAALGRAQIEEEVSSKSLEEQGIDRIATIHEGHKDSPGRDERHALNEKIKAVNAEREAIEHEEAAIRTDHIRERLGECGGKVSSGFKTSGERISRTCSEVKGYLRGKYERIKEKIRTACRVKQILESAPGGQKHHNMASSTIDPAKMTAQERRKAFGKVFVPGMVQNTGNDTLNAKSGSVERTPVQASDQAKAAKFRNGFKKKPLYIKGAGNKKIFKIKVFRKAVWSSAYKLHTKQSFHDFITKQEEGHDSIRI